MFAAETSPPTPTRSIESVLILETRAEAQAWSDGERAEGRRVGLVPTMGALHDGHLHLIKVAKSAADVVAVSLFVNPIQFNRADDFDRYPRTWDFDVAACEREGVHAIYAPSALDMYPDGFQTYVEPGALATFLEGEFRPGHFRGVATVVTKLFNAVRPDVAVFGQKDFQQLAIVTRMAADLDTGIEIVGVPTVREADGLALSSRNRLLAPDDRARAVCIPHALDAAGCAAAQGERSAAALVAAARAVLDSEPAAQVEYLELRDAVTLESIDEVQAPVVLLVAVWLGGVRLIDNLVVAPEARVGAAV
jgi:pantoate--beta-alanine ligase